MATDLGNEFRGVAHSGDTSVGQMGVNMQAHLENVMNPPEPIQVKAEIQCQRDVGYDVECVSHAMAAQPSSILGDCMGAVTKLADDVGCSLAGVKEELSPKAPDPEVVAQVEALENTQYTKAAEQNFDMNLTPTAPGMSA